MNKSSHLRDLSKRTSGGGNTNVSAGNTRGSTKWRTIIALVLMYITILMDWQWAWGILFLIWVIPDLFRGVTYFIEPIEKKENPILYWVIVISWILMSLYSLSTLFIDYNQYSY